MRITTYQNEKIIRQYKLVELLEVPKQKCFINLRADPKHQKYKTPSVMDFARVRVESGMGIIESWMRHFKDLGVPFVVTQNEHFITLWKERRA